MPANSRDTRICGRIQISYSRRDEGSPIRAYFT
jgi:hypothetical protein